MTDRDKAFLRWLMVIPAAVGGYVVSCFLFYAGSEGNPDALFQIASFCISPAVFIVCGVKTAPKHRFVTAIILSVLWAITVTALFTWSATARGYDDWFRTGRSLLWAILGVISVLVTSFIIRSFGEDDKLFEEATRKRADSSSSTGGNAQSERHDVPLNSDPHEILGVRRSDSFETIRKAYRERMKEYHPDKVAGLGKELRELAERKAKEINRAFEKLKEMHGAN